VDWLDLEDQVVNGKTNVTAQPPYSNCYNFNDAECQDEKDKVYGCAGLALDARNFMIDYNKSLFQICTDNKTFLNWQGLYADKGMISVGYLANSLLPGTDCSHLK
jgi:hypothetical protein